MPPLNRTLALEIVPESTELAPGESTAIDLTLTDAAGLPVEGGELAVVVVDEAILALTGYQLADPVAAFYQQRYADVSGYHSRSQIVLQDADEPVQETEVVTRRYAGKSQSQKRYSIAQCHASHGCGNGVRRKWESFAADMAMAPAPMAMAAVASVR